MIYGSEFALVVVPESESGVYWDRLLLDGAIIADPAAGDPNLRALRARDIPCVTVGRDPDAPDEGLLGGRRRRGGDAPSFSTTSPPRAPATSPPSPG